MTKPILERRVGIFWGVRWVALAGIVAAIAVAVVFGLKVALIFGLGGLVYALAARGFAYGIHHAASGETELTELHGRPRPSSS